VNLGNFRILLSFFRTSWFVGVLNSAIFNSFHNRVDFGTILEGLQNFFFWGGGGGLNTHTHTPWYATAFIYCVHPAFMIFSSVGIISDVIRGKTSAYNLTVTRDVNV